MRRVLPLALLGFAAACASGEAQPRPDGDRTAADAIYDAAPGRSVERIGTFRPVDLVVAFYRSQHFDDELGRIRAARDAALAQGDTERAAAIEAEGARMQEVAHQQLAGTAPLDNILEPLAGHLQSVAERAGVERILPENAPRDPGAETVDVTALLVEQLPPRTDRG